MGCFPPTRFNRNISRLTLVWHNREVKGGERDKTIVLGNIWQRCSLFRSLVSGGNGHELEFPVLLPEAGDRIFEEDRIESDG